MLTISASNTYEVYAAGAYQPCEFVALEETTTSKGAAWRWKWRILHEGPYKGKIISELSDRESPPTERNKTGRWLSALAVKPLTAGNGIEPAEYVGKRYLVVIGPKPGDAAKTQVITFSPLA